MDITKKILFEPGYLLERMDDEITVYHPTLTTSLYLNETGALIWELCDGKRTIAEVIHILLELYPENKDQVELDVKLLLRRFLEKGVAKLG